MIMHDLVAEILSAMRRKRRGLIRPSHEELAYDERDVREVLKALDEAGYIVVPKGVVDALKKLMGKL
ncbi:Uncharacterised protein [uncultured archaeon]|nr:Uncharacterised protein [uncultured archaeon]